MNSPQTSKKRNKSSARKTYSKSPTSKLRKLEQKLRQPFHLKNNS